MDFVFVFVNFLIDIIDMIIDMITRYKYKLYCVQLLTMMQEVFWFLWPVKFPTTYFIRDSVTVVNKLILWVVVQGNRAQQVSGIQKNCHGWFYKQKIILEMVTVKKDGTIIA